MERVCFSSPEQAGAHAFTQQSNIRPTAANDKTETWFLLCFVAYLIMNRVHCAEDREDGVKEHCRQQRWLDMALYG